MNSFRCCSRMLFVLSIVIVSLNRASAEDRPDVKKRAERLWKKIQTMSADDPERYKRELADYWAEIAWKCYPPFEKMATDPNYREMLTYFVDQFGRHGAQADMRWLLVDTTMTVAQLGGPGHVRGNDRLGPAEIAICELLVRKCLADRKFLKRYYVATMWTGLFCMTDTRNGVVLTTRDPACGLAVAQTRAGFANRRENEYWWFARNFVLLAHAVGRDDLLTGCDPQKLDTRWKAFDKWYTANYVYLRVDPKYPRWLLDEQAKKSRLPARKNEPPPLRVPKTPFPDWEGPPPPPAKAFRHFS